MREKYNVFGCLSQLSASGARRSGHSSVCGVKGKIRAKYHIYKTAPPYLDRFGIRDFPHNRTRRAGAYLFLRSVATSRNMSGDAKASARTTAPMVARPLPTVDEVKARLNRLTQAFAKAKTIIGNEVYEVELRLKNRPAM